MQRRCYESRMTRVLTPIAVLFLSTMSTAPVAAEPSAVRIAEPIFSPKIRSEQKYGGPGLFYPERAARGRRPIDGVAVIECSLAANGFLNDCRIISETPASCPFGYAAQHMAEHRVLLAAPRLVGGQPVSGETVRLEIAFGHPEKGRRPGVCPSP